MNESFFSEEVINSDELSLNNTYEQLIIFSQSNNFVSQMTNIFGEKIISEELIYLKDAWTLGNFSALPTMEFLPESVMSTTQGAFSNNTNKIYLSSDFVTKKTTIQIF